VLREQVPESLRVARTLGAWKVRGLLRHVGVHYVRRTIEVSDAADENVRESRRFPRAHPTREAVTRSFPKPVRYHTVTLASAVHQAAWVLEFLKQAFGSKVVDHYDAPEESIAHREMKLRDAVVMFSNPPPAAGAELRRGKALAQIREAARFDDLTRRAEAWARARAVLAFIDAVEQGAKVPGAAATAGTAVTEWVAWARQKARDVEATCIRIGALVDGTGESLQRFPVSR
jgi:uncharacterized glyoxalase superfamily protein PhnB